MGNLNPILRHCRLFVRALVTWLLISALNGAPAAWAADERGRYTAYGPGGKRCDEIRAAANTNQEPLFQAWLSGFVTAENYRLAGARDLLDDRNMVKAWQWILTFCDHHQSASFSDVAALFALNQMDVLAARYAEHSSRIKTPKRKLVDHQAISGSLLSPSD